MTITSTRKVYAISNLSDDYSLNDVVFRVNMLYELA